MDKFKVFKTQIDMPPNVLQYFELKEVQVDSKSKVWHFHIDVKSSVDVHHLMTFESYLKVYFKTSVISKVTVSFHQKADFDTPMLEKYIQTIVHEYQKLKPSAGALKHFNFNIDHDVIMFHVDEDSAYIKQHFKQIEKMLHTYGLFFTLDLSVNKEIPKATAVIENEKKQLDVIHDKQIKYKKDVPLVDSNKFTTRHSPEAMKISNIPMDQYRFDQYRNEHGQSDCIIEGQVRKVELRTLTKTKLLTMILADEDDAIKVKSFVSNPKDEAFAKTIKEGHFLQVTGYFQYDSFDRDINVMAKKMLYLDRKQHMREDDAKRKRIEFHMHSTMSNLDGITSITDYVNQAKLWGHEAIAITDHDGVYGFPELDRAAKKSGIKPIFGTELSCVDQNQLRMIDGDINDSDMKSQTYVVFDIETTGFSVIHDDIIEIAAVKVKNGTIIETYQQFIDPKRKLSAFTSELTGITDEMVADQPLIEDALTSFLAFSEGAMMVAHNATFDIDFIEAKASRNHLTITYKGFLDTLLLARLHYSDVLKSFNLKAVAKHFKIKQEAHHRAEDDARVTAEIWILMMQELSKKGYTTISDYFKMNQVEHYYQLMIPFHLNILVKEQKGLKNLYKIVSHALTTFYHKGARTSKQIVDMYRDGLLIGSGCYKGEVFETALNKSSEKLEEVMRFYDYVEVQPPESYLHIIDQIGEGGKEIIEATIKKIVDTATKLSIPVIATGDVHYLHPEDHMYRDIYISTPQVGGGIHDLKRYQVKPKLHFKTTNEMLHAFAFLGVDAERIVVEETHRLNRHIDTIQLFPSGLLAIQDDAFSENIQIPSIEAEVKRLVKQETKKQYGDTLHPIVSRRVDRELKNIIENQFASIYYMSHLLVKNSLEEGYLVGSRGSVGSSLVATLLNITEVNPLKPHYRCKEGHFTAFKLTEEGYQNDGYQPHEEDFQTLFENVYAGYDLPDANCPICQSKLIKDGHDIPFETFLGFNGDKIPDIDLNFSGEYQSKAHDYVKLLVGENQAYRAGTIQTIAERNAFGYVKGYLEDHHIEKRPAQIERLAKKIEGVKRSTGQHPGGIIVVPDGYDIYDVTPIQYPANNTDNVWYTTHYDYHAFESNLLKLDILGHDDPTMIKFFMDHVKRYPDKYPFTDAKDIPLDDKDVMKMFYETNIIGVSKDDLMSDIASFAIPEFNTQFTRQMLSDIKPKTFAGLVKVSGLSHGTDVWLKNAQDLVRGSTSHGRVDIDQIIGCRDDIMVQLIDFGLEPLRAFEIMEFVRKGKPSKDPSTWLTYESEMRLAGVPEWYIWSCQQIKYMFPKAHATAYVIMALRIAWFKIHDPLLFYSAYFSKRVDKFDYEKMIAGPVALKNGIKELLAKNYLTVNEQSILTTLQVAYEMSLRGFHFKKVDINCSDAKTFIMEDDALRMPFISIDGLGENVANGIVDTRTSRVFSSKEDIKLRTKINQTVFAKMESYGAFDELIIENDEKEQGLFAL